MASPYVVALVLDPEFGDHLRTVSQRVYAWIVGTPANRAVVEEMWRQLPKPIEYDIEAGATWFDYDSKAEKEAWCEAIIGTIDQHHDEMSRSPGYTVLEVYGMQFQESLRPAFTELGFSLFEETSYGFRAIKSKP